MALNDDGSGDIADYYPSFYGQYDYISWVSPQGSSSGLYKGVSVRCKKE